MHNYRVFGTVTILNYLLTNQELKEGCEPMACEKMNWEAGVLIQQGLDSSPQPFVQLLQLRCVSGSERGIRPFTYCTNKLINRHTKNDPGEC